MVGDLRGNYDLMLKPNIYPLAPYEQIHINVRNYLIVIDGREQNRSYTQQYSLQR